MVFRFYYEYVFYFFFFMCGVRGKVFVEVGGLFVILVGDGVLRGFRR